MCYNPVKIGKRFVNCGKCFSCQQKDSKGWAVRIMLEAEQYSQPPYLITLTYNEENVSYDEEKLLRDITLFIKKMRKSFGKLRYYYCMEYGALRGRPHFHMILFGLPLDDLKYFKTTKKGERIYLSSKIQSKWTNDDKISLGFSSVGIMDDVSQAKYVTLYMQKGKAERRGFRRMSKVPAIGCLNIDKKLGWLETGKFVLRGKSYPLPKIFLNAFYKLGYVREVVAHFARRYLYWDKASKDLQRSFDDLSFYKKRCIELSRLRKCGISLDFDYMLC